MIEISLTTTGAARHLLDTISRAESLGWTWSDGMRHVEAEHPISGDLMQAQAWLALAMEKPLLCACRHEHASGSDGEDAGCLCADGHDWTAPVLRAEGEARMTAIERQRELLALQMTAGEVRRLVEDVQAEAAQRAIDELLTVERVAAALSGDDFRDEHERAMRDHILARMHTCDDLCSDDIVDRMQTAAAAALIRELRR